MKQIFLMSQCQYTRLGLFAVMDSAGQHAVQVISVETPEQIEMIHSKNSVYAQGYFFFKPMPVADAEDLLSNVPHEHYNHAHKAVSDDTTVTEPKSSVELLHETTVTHSIFKILSLRKISCFLQD